MLTTAKCIREFYWTSKNKTFVPGDTLAGEYKDLSRLEDARVIVIDREEAAVVAPTENAAARTSRPRGR